MQKEKVIQIFESFFGRNSNYVVYAYLKNGITGNNIANMNLKNREIEEREGFLRVSWDENKHLGIYMHNFSIHYDEVVSCYEEIDEYGSQSVRVIFQNGIIVNFECCGEPIEK